MACTTLLERFCVLQMISTGWAARYFIDAFVELRHGQQPGTVGHAGGVFLGLADVVHQHFRFEELSAFLQIDTQRVGG